MTGKIKRLKEKTSRDQIKAQAQALQDKAVRAQARLEKARGIGPVTLAVRRCGDMKSGTLTALIAVYLLLAILPLGIIAASYLNKFTHLDITTGIVHQFDLQGHAANAFHRTFDAVQMHQGAATLFGLLSFGLVGIQLATIVQETFARAWREPKSSMTSAYSRGAIWFGVAFVNLVISETFMYHSRTRGVWLSLLALVVLSGLAFFFWFITPVILLKRRFTAKELLPTAVCGTILHLLLRLGLWLIFPNWLEWYGVALDTFGIAIAIIYWLFVTAYAWVFVAAFGAVVWEKRHGTLPAIDLEGR